MNRTKLKNYAPLARRDFIQAMKDRAAFYGLTANKIEPVVERGDVVVIVGREHPRVVAKKRKQLEDRIKQHGFEQTMEALAYTWFNRLVAIRFMELHGYLEHGYRVLSHPEGKTTPEILEHAEHVEFPGLNKGTVIDLKLAGNKEGELYRLLLTAQCNALHEAMPFLFERIGDETELVLPDNLLHSDSLIRKLVSQIDEEDWQEVEIIGWLYQFYISEKKDEVIGKMVASEDIPAATQLFTPNWIVKYLVQNTLGRQWLAPYPQSSLREQMEYYIEPAEQTPEVQTQLKAITPTSLNPEEITLLDPACGSGHILVEAYDLFKAIYQERGYRAKDIPALILQKNLFGLEIDDRAAQLAAFALMMKARADDRRIFDSHAKPNILAFEDSQGMNATDITHALNSPINKNDVPSKYLFEEIEEAETPLFSKKVMAEKGHVSQGDIASLLELFENAKTIGSLIQVPPKLAAKLPGIEERLDEVLKHGDLMHTSAHVIGPLLQQARILARQYDCVVANPPYMGTKHMNPLVKKFANDCFPDSKADLFAVCTERFLSLAKQNGFLSLMTPFTWMFLRTYESLRNKLVEEKTLHSLIQPEYHAFFDSAYVPICAFVVQNQHVANFQATFIDLGDFIGVEQQPVRALEAIRTPACSWRFKSKPDDFKRIPASRIVYWASEGFRKLFDKSTSLGDRALKGLDTGGNIDMFLRRWSEVKAADITSLNDRGNRWFPLAKGGPYRRWYGNHEFVINYQDQGRDLRANKANLRSESKYLQPGLTWTVVTVADFAVRQLPPGFLFDQAGSSIFAVENDPFSLSELAASLNSKVTTAVAKMLSPTISATTGDVREYPVLRLQAAGRNAAILVEMAKNDWDNYESSWDFRSLPLLAACSDPVSTLESSYNAWIIQNRNIIAETKRLEEENNRLFIDAYGLVDDLTADFPVEQITLTVNPAYRYGGKQCNEELWARFRQDTIGELISYTIGCVMGRYSLDKPGLIYAHSGNQGFDSSQYMTFRADDDGIIPLLGTDWGIRDDASNRIVEFVGVAWPKEHLDENLKFIAESLGSNNGEQPRETIRRYLANGFYKHHLSMYKKRPIYWLFSSGKQRAFQCLVYLHRYHEGTLARIRTEYVIPLQGQIASRIDQLEGDKTKATSTSHRNKLQKEQDNLKKQQTELITFEEKLKHAADQKISLDLDDGVKVNYGKFGDLLAEAKAITGGKDDE